MLNLKKLLGLQPQQKVAPKLSKLPMKQYMQPAQRDFPGKTNYGVPQDNMIDTPNGYITPEQYNAQSQLRVKPNFGVQSKNYQTGQVNPVDMDSVPGNMQFGNNPAYYQGSNPFQNQPRKNLYQNISPMPVDEMRYGRQIQNAGDNYNPFY